MKKKGRKSFVPRLLALLVAAVMAAACLLPAMVSAEEGEPAAAEAPAGGENAGAQIELEITITGEKKTVEYTGAQQSVSGFKAECTEGDKAQFHEDKVKLKDEFSASASGTEPGEYAMGLKPEWFTYDDPNVKAKFKIKDGGLTISEPAAAPAEEKSSDEPSGANEEEQDSYQDNNDTQGNDNAEGTDGNQGSDGYSEYPDAYTGEGSPEENDDENSDGEQLPPVISDPTDPSLAGEGEKTKITITVSGSGETKAYTGAELEGGTITTSSDSMEFNRENVVSNFEPAKGTDAGTYTAALDASMFSYNDENVEAEFVIDENAPNVSLTIAPAEITIAISGEKGNKPYTGSEQTLTGFTAECSDTALFDAAKISDDGAASVSGTNAGTYPMGLADKLSSFTYDDPNVNATFNLKEDGELVIDKVKMTIDITGAKDETKVYNKKEQNLTGFTAESKDEGFDSSKVSDNGAASVSGTAANTYPMGLADKLSSFTYDDPNVDATFQLKEDGEMIISKAKLEIKVDGAEESKVYNGETQTLNSYTAVCESDPDKIFVAAEVKDNGKAVASGKDAGKYETAITADMFSYNDENVEATFVPGKKIVLTITKAPLTIQTASASKQYDGQPLTKKDGVTFNGLKGSDKVSVNVTGSQTQPGSSKNTFTYSFTSGKESNYTVTKAEGTLSVHAYTFDNSWTNSSRTWSKRSNANLDILVHRNPDDENITSYFRGIQVDGAAIANTNYSVYKANGGGMTVRLNQAYLARLADGTHTLTIVFNDGSAQTQFIISSTVTGTVSANGTIVRPGSVQTGDTSRNLLWIGLLTGAAAVCGLLVYIRRKKA